MSPLETQNFGYYKGKFQSLFNCYFPYRILEIDGPNRQTGSVFEIAFDDSLPTEASFSAFRSINFLQLHESVRQSRTNGFGIYSQLEDFVVNYHVSSNT